jgi:hypothetical protein
MIKDITNWNWKIIVFWWNTHFPLFSWILYHFSMDSNHRNTSDWFHQ